MLHTKNLSGGFYKIGIFIILAVATGHFLNIMPTTYTCNPNCYIISVTIIFILGMLLGRNYGTICDHFYLTMLIIIMLIVSVLFNILPLGLIGIGFLFIVISAFIQFTTA